MALGWVWWRAWFPPPRVFAWQAWHLATWTFTLRGKRGTWQHHPSLCVAGLALVALGWLWWRAWFPFGAVGAAAVCVAGLALGDMDLHFAWQAWHLVTWILTLRGRRGTYGTGLALGWLWWRAWFSGVAVGAAAFCVAGVALCGM